MYLPHVVVDYSTARNVLEHEIRECKIKLIRRNDGQICAVVLVDKGVAARPECLLSQSDHLSANVHAVNLAKDACQRLCDPASATPYLKDFHSSGISTLADVHHVVEDVAFHRLFTGRKKLSGAPLLVRCGNVVWGILDGTLVPIVSYLGKLVFDGDVPEAVPF